MQLGSGERDRLGRTRRRLADGNAAFTRKVRGARCPECWAGRRTRRARRTRSPVSDFIATAEPSEDG